MESKFLTLPVRSFCICDEDEGVHIPECRTSFEEAEKLLTKLREENPLVEYSLVAEIDA